MPIQFKEKNNQASSGLGAKYFIKLKNGEHTSCVLRGNPYEFRKHWNQATKRSSVCTQLDKGSCEGCTKGLKSSFAFRINAIVKEGSDYVAKVFEQGWTVYENLAALGEDMDLEKTVIKITRHGTGLQDTSYTLIPKVNERLSDHQLEVISKVKLHDLANLDATLANEEKKDKLSSMASSFTPSFNEEDIPF